MKTKITIMKKIITFILIIFSLGAFAQQEAGFSMYFFNPVYVNPGYAGSRDVLSGSIVYRSQWTGMPGAPISQSMSLHSAIPNTKIGIGLLVYHDAAGPMKNTGANLTFAYHIKLSKNAKLSLGVSGMLNNIRVNWSQINFDDDQDPSFTANKSSSWVGDASAGLYFYMPRFYVGISGVHLLQSKFRFTNAVDADNAKFYRQFYLTSGVVIPMGKSVDFRPSILLKYVQGAPFVGEIDASFILFKKVFLGVGYRGSKRINMSGMDNILVGIVEYDITRYLRIGYSYDFYLNRNELYNTGGTHEIMLGWDIGFNKTKLSSPRFF